MNPPSEEEQKQAALRTSTALQQGELPHNPELNAMIDRATATLESTQLASNLNPEGVRIAHDASDVMHNLKTVVEEKNRDEHLQRMHFHVKEAIKEVHVISSQTAPINTNVLSTAEWKIGAEAVRDLAQSVVTDGEFRSVLWEFGSLIRDIFSDTVSSAHISSTSRHVQPTSVPAAPVVASNNPIVASNNPVGPVRVENFKMDQASGQPIVTLQTSSEPFGSSAGFASLSPQQPLHEYESDEEQEARDPTYRYRYSLEENESLRRTFLTGAPLSDVRHAQLADRFSQLMVKLHQDPRRVNALRTLIGLMQTTCDHIQPQLQQQTQVVSEDPVLQYHFSQAVIEAQALLESFAMNKSLDPLIYGWRGFVAQTRNDIRFKTYFSQLNEFFLRSVNEPEFVRSPNYRQELNFRIESGRALLSEYRALLYTITNELDDFLLCLRRDDTARRLSDSTHRLVADLFYDDNGRPTFKPSALVELRKILVPLIADQLKFIAIPRITGSDESVEYAIENIAFRGQDILPNHIKIHNVNDMDFDTRTGADQYNATIYVNVDNIQANLQNIHFWYKRKTTPKLTDQGEMDLIIDGKGICIQLWLAPTKEAGHLFTPSRVRCDIQRVKIRHVRAEHKVLYAFFRPIIQNRLRRALIAAVEENVSRLALLIDQQLVALGNKALEISHLPAAKQEQPVAPTNQQTSAFNWTPSTDTRRNY